MKTIRSFAIVLAVICLTISSFGQAGQSSLPSPLPATLPIGDEMLLRHWIFTNRPSVYVYVLISCTNLTDGTKYSYARAATPTNFPAYSDFEKYVVARATEAIDWIKTYHVDPDSRITMILDSFYDPGDYFNILNVRMTNFARIGSVTDTQIKNIEPKWEVALLPIDKLEKLELHVEANPPLDYVSSEPPINTYPPYTRQVILNNILPLYGWYSRGTNRVRLTVTAGGYTRTYTQFGVPIGQSRVRMIDPNHIQVPLIPGADTSLQQSDDLKVWSDMPITDWTCRQTMTNCFVPVSSSKHFFRSVSK